MDLDLKALEEKIDELIKALEWSRLENRSLNKKVSSLNNENLVLLNQKKMAKEALKKLALQLKDELCQNQK